MGTLTQVRTGLASAMSGITTAQRYRFMPVNPQFPAIVVGFPDEFDPFADETGSRTMTVPVWCGVESKDEASADDELMSLIESVATVLVSADSLSGVADSVRPLPAVQFSASQSGDDRVTLWCAIPVEVFA